MISDTCFNESLFPLGIFGYRHVMTDDWFSVDEKICPFQKMIDELGINGNIAPLNPEVPSVGPHSKRDDVATQVFKTVMSERGGVTGQKVDTVAHSVFDNCEAPAVAPVQVVAQSTSTGFFGFLFGAFLAISGIGLVLNAQKHFENGVRHNDLEKMGISSLDLLAGISALATGVLVVTEWICKFAKHVGTALVTGAAIPVATIIMYASGLVSSIYKFYVLWKFRSEFAMISKDDPVKVLEFIKNNTQLTSQEIEDLGDEESMVKALHRKWENFTTRTASETIKELTGVEDLNHLIEEINRGSFGALDHASELIHKIQDNNGKELKWKALAIFGNLLGIAASVIYLVTTGPAGIIVPAVIFAIASIILLIGDHPKTREFFDRAYETLFSFVK